MKKEKIFWLLGSTIVFSSILHFYRIGYPAVPVFDEAHFATYAADYAQGAPSFDIHPPLGKLMFAGALRLSGYEATARDSFVQLVPLKNGGFRAEPGRDSFAGFPYVLLRVLSALFGVALPILVYFFLRNIGLGAPASLVGAFFAAAENALLVQTRFIFLDGMYLAFGLVALALYFNKRVPGWVSGVVFGLALGVKLTAATFIGPVIADAFLTKESSRRLWIFLGSAMLACVAVFILGSAFIEPQEQRVLWNEFGVFDNAVPSVGSNESLPAATLRNAGLQILVSLSGYLGGEESRSDDSERTSRWYEWPFMRNLMPYYLNDGTTKNIVFAGNRVVWGLSTVAMLVALFSALALFLRSARGRVVHVDRQMLLLFAGYLTSMLPFIFFVSRPTYPYHYLPALVFAMGLAAWLFDREFGFSQDALTRKQKRWLIAIALAVLIGFLLAAPTTYGL